MNEVIMGQVLPCGCGQNPARQAAYQAGMPWETECLTVNKVCGSSLKAIMLAAQAIKVGDTEVVVAGGMENMSAAPYYNGQGPVRITAWGKARSTTTWCTTVSGTLSTISTWA